MVGKGLMPAINVSAVTSTEIVPADYNRLLIAIVNTHATSLLYINFGAIATTDEVYVPPGGNISIGDSRAKCSINGLSSSGTIVAKYSQLSPGT